ncbi:MAG: ATP-binding protein [Myxococcota bacterium]
MTSPWPLETLLQVANDAVYLLEDDRFVYVNTRFEQLFGYTRAELCRPEFDPRTLIHPDDRPGIEARRRLSATGSPLPNRYEFKAINRDRRRLYIEVSITYLRAHQRHAVLGVVQDVSARKAYEQQLLRNNHELSVTNVIADAITEVQDLGCIIEQVVERLIEVLGVDAAGVSILDDTQERFTSTHYKGTSETFIRSMRQRNPSNGVLGLAYRTRSIQIIEDIETDPRLEFGAASQEGFRSAVAVPLISKSPQHDPLSNSAWPRLMNPPPPGISRRPCSGVVSVFTRQPRRFDAEDISLFIRVARQIAVAIENARLYGYAAEGMARLQALSEIARAISSTLDVEGVFRIVGDRLRPLIDYSAVDLLVLDDVEQCFRVRRIERPPEGATPIVRLQEPRPVDADPLLTDALFSQQTVMRDSPIPVGGQQAIVPIVSDQAPVGLFLVTAPTPFRDTDLQLLNDLAAHMAISLRNARTFSELERAYRELKDAQELLVRAEKLQALGEMAAGVAHDFNNVLSAILGRAQMLEVMLINPEHLRSVKVIEKAALDGAGTVRRIQAFAKEKPESPLAPVTLNPIVRESMERAAPLAANPSRAVETVMDLGEVPQVLGDAVELREALGNLINNALDAMPHGGRLTVRTGGDGGPWFEVEDTGIGMAPETANRIFDPFFSTKGDQGSGLGLSVTYAIVQRHGGRFEVDSERNRGTRIRVYLEDAQVSGDWPTAAASSDNESDTPDVTRQGARVLLIEDDVAVRDVLADILRTGEHQVITAANGVEGLRRFAENEFDMVLTDLGMPEMDGWAVARAVKEQQPDMPVGLITGWGSELDDTDLTARGVDVLVSKPVRFSDVLDAVDRALTKR